MQPKNSNNVSILNNSTAITNSMLEEIWIQILVKSVCKTDARLLPLCLMQQQKASVFTDELQQLRLSVNTAD